MDALGHGWVEIGGRTFAQRLRTTVVSPLGAEAALIAIGLFFIVMAAFPGVTGIGLWDAAAIVVALCTFMVAVTASTHARNPAPLLNVHTGHLRVGDDVVSFHEIDRAIVHRRAQPRGSLSWHLGFGASGHRQAVVTVRSLRTPELSLNERQLVAAAIRASSISTASAVLPVDHPLARTAYAGNPDLLTRDEALAYVLDTPRSGSPQIAPDRRVVRPAD